jgi:hypothetical protein
MKTYGDFSREEIDAIVNAPDFEEKMAKAQKNMDDYMLALTKAADERIVRECKAKKSGIHRVK